jgi:hypothetical protein
MASKMCGGNNYGWYGGYSDYGDGPHYDAHFGPGTTFVHVPNHGSTQMTNVHISSWTGQTKC